MKDKQLTNLLHSASYPSPDPEQKKEHITELLEFSKKCPTHRQVSFRKQFFSQITYISKMVWICQLLLLITFLSLCYTKNSSLQIIYTTGLFTPFLSILMIIEINKSLLHGMWELESTCYFNFKQVCMIRMILIGLADYILLTIFFVICGLHHLGYQTFLLLVLLPFQVENMLFLFISRKIASIRSANYIYVGLAVFISILLYSLQFYQIQWIVKMSPVISSTVTIFVCVVTFIAMIYMMYRYINNKKEVLSAWN